MTKTDNGQHWLRAGFPARGLTRVDREAGVIRGYTVAQRGPFKSEGRGEFDDKSLSTIVKMMGQKPKGLKVRFAHPTLSADGIGKFLGRARDPRIDGDAVRADLHFDKTALDTPIGGGIPLGEYVMNLAESDPESFGSSLVLSVDEEYRLNKDKTPVRDDAGNVLPPLWRPKALHASDVVDEGDAVHDGFLSADPFALPDGVVRLASDLLDRQFGADASRSLVEERCRAWLSRYLDRRYPNSEPPEDPQLRAKIERMKLTVAGMKR